MTEPTAEDKLRQIADELGGIDTERKEEMRERILRALDLLAELGYAPSRTDNVWDLSSEWHYLRWERSEEKRRYGC